MSMEEGCYIINRMYAGDYLSGKNIGHEIINLFADDKGDNYIYVNSDGLINPKYNGKVKGVILVRKTDSIHRLEVLGVAKVDADSQISLKSNKLTRPERLKEQNAVVDAYLEKHKVSYGGVSQTELFEKNKFNGIPENYHIITFKAKELLLPYFGRKVYITDHKSKDEADCHLKKVIFPSQSLKRYIDTEEFPDDFKEITKLMQNDKLWDKNRKSEKLKEVGRFLKESDSFNFLDIIGKQDDENVFSNMIAYFLSNDSELLTGFCEKVLGIPGVSGDAIIEREKSANGSRIDIYIEDEEHAIVIENKIKSEVNSVEERHNFTGEQIKSQLMDYYNYIEKNAKDKKRHYFILLPNYHQIDIKKYKHSEKYQSINYDAVFHFFGSWVYKNRDEAWYYADFVKALKRHAENYYDDQYAEMKRRFIRRITECKAKKKL